jgi:hypothetical protein
MRFTSIHPFATTSFYRMSMIRDAVAIVTKYRLSPKEFRLNQYLLTNYKKDLKMIAIDLIKHCKVYHDLDKTAVVIFRNKQDDDLATLITYGTDFIPGSNILKKAFMRKE